MGPSAANSVPAPKKRTPEIHKDDVARKFMTQPAAAHEAYRQGRRAVQRHAAAFLPRFDPPPSEPVEQVDHRRDMPASAALGEHAALVKLACYRPQAGRASGADVRDN